MDMVDPFQCDHQIKKDGILSVQEIIAQDLQIILKSKSRKVSEEIAKSSEANGFNFSENLQKYQNNLLNMNMNTEDYLKGVVDVPFNFHKFVKICTPQQTYQFCTFIKESKLHKNYQELLANEFSKLNEDLYDQHKIKYLNTEENTISSNAPGYESKPKAYVGQNQLSLGLQKDVAVLMGKNKK